MRIDQKNKDYILDFYFNHLEIVKFNLFGSWGIQMEPQKEQQWREREKRKEIQRSRFYYENIKIN